MLKKNIKSIDKRYICTLFRSASFVWVVMLGHFYRLLIAAISICPSDI